MVGGGVVARPSEPRVSTGNRSLDDMLEGGLVAHRPYLIVGPSGTGKTTLAIQFLCEGVRRHERVLLVTLEEPPNEAKVNHRGLEPSLSRVEVFDAIPDIMRYERTPFKDIASVRTAIPFAEVPLRIRQSPELASVEVTITALEQMLRTEVIRRGYSRIVIDSLTALQYFCMKGFEPIAGAQSFLRFLSDLHVTTLLTVESPLEDVDTPERMLARGEVRLFRWELDGQTVRAIGVEKFRGSSHDVRLHPYRIGPQGIDINLEVTISRDTRQIIEPLVPAHHVPAPELPTAAPITTTVTPLIDEVRDLILLGADVAPARSEIEAALTATNEGHPDQAQPHLSRVTSLVMGLVDQLSRSAQRPKDPSAVAALQRVLARADSVRTGVPPTSLPPATVLQVQLGALLSLLPPPAPTPTEEVAPAPSPAPATTEITPSTATPVTPPAPVVEPAPSPVAPAVPASASAPEGPASPPVGVESPAAVSVPISAPVPAVEADTAPPAPAPVTVPPTEATRPAVAETETPPAPPSPPAPPPTAARSRAGRTLPAPPKPRSPVPSPRVAKSSTVPPPHPGSSKPSPPPLPTTSSPPWPGPPTSATPPPATAPTHPAAEPSTPILAPEGPAHGPGAPTKKRRKTAAAASAPKRSAAHARASAAHPAAGAVAPLPESPALPQPTAPAPPGGPVESLPVPKPRKRPARKRKAPPVVSVTVEPIPPGVFANPDDASQPTDGPDKTPDSEG